MKNLLYFLLISSLAIFFRCTTDFDTEPVTEKVQFTVDVSHEKVSGGRQQADLPNDALLLISVDDNSGRHVLTHERISLLKIGDDYITEPLELAPGNYKIIDFMIVQNSEVLFVTPKKGSPLAPAVSRSLPSNFWVGKNHVSNIAMQVVSTADQEPEAFGYVSFSIDVVMPLAISVLSAENGAFKFISAQADLMEDDQIIKTYSLGAKVNVIGFSEDPDKSYTLKVSARGYTEYTRDITYYQLIEELKGNPLKVTLKPALEMDINVFFSESPFSLAMAGQGEVIISGAGGIGGMYTMPFEITDIHFPTGMNELEIIGDLNQINYISFDGYDMRIEKMAGLKHLVGLQDLNAGISVYEKDLDFTHNKKLTSIGFWYLKYWLKLPEDHNIRTFAAPYAQRPMPSEPIDYIVNNLYKNTIKKSIYNGIMHLPYPESLSENTITKLTALRNEYGWEVIIDDYDF